MDLKEEKVLSSAINDHWYYVSKARALRRSVRHLPRGAVLDVGAGSGIFSRILLDDGWLESTCVDPGYGQEEEAEHHGRPLRFVRETATSDARLVLMMDVCEHVEDDVALVRGYAGKVETGTHFLITVPAFPFLFSGHDVFLEHYRRYTVAGIEVVLRKAGLDVLWGHYFFAGIFPMAAATRIYEKHLLGRNPPAARSSLKHHGPAVNSALKAFCAVELPVMRANRAFGLSIFCLARKT